MGKRVKRLWEVWQGTYGCVLVVASSAGAARRRFWKLRMGSRRVPITAVVGRWAEGWRRKGRGQ
jgi:hypothetical protein